jgi:prepilin peptidase CpaA
MDFFQVVPMNPLALVSLVLILSVAAFADVRTHRIPNALVFGGIVMGIVLHAHTDGLDGAYASFAGVAVAMGLLLPAYAWRLIGAGDVKLLGAVGAFLGPAGAFGAVVATFIAGGLLAFAMSLRQGSAVQLGRNLGLMMAGGLIDLQLGSRPDPTRYVRSVGQMPYAVAILVGVVGWLVFVRIRS